MKKLVLVGIVVLVVLGMLYRGLSTQLENDLTNDAMQRLSTISVEQSDQLKRLYKASRKDILALYQWPQLSDEIGVFFGEDIGAVDVTLHKTLRLFAEHYDYNNVLLFDKQQNLVMWLDSSPNIMAGFHQKEALLAALKPILATAVSRLQVSVSPFFPSLEALYQQGGNDSNAPNLRETFLVAPLISEQKIVGSIALGKQVDDLSLLNPTKMRFGQSGYVTFIEKGSEAAFGLRFPRALQGRPEIVRQGIDNSSSQLVRVLNESSGIGLYHDSDGRGQLGIWQYMPEFNMGILVYQSTDEIYAGVAKFHLLALFAFLFTLIVTFAMGWTYVKILLGRVTHVAERLGKLSHFVEHPDASKAAPFALLDELLERIERRLHKDNEVLLSTKKRLRFFMKELEDQRFAFDQHCIIVVADADGTFTDANRQFSDLSGYSRSELIGAKFDRFGGDYQNARIRQEIFDAMHAGEVWQGELNLVKRGGR